LETWLRQRPQLNVLLLSEDNSKSLLMRAMRAGVREVLPLPPDPDELAQSLKRLSERFAALIRQNTVQQPAEGADAASTRSGRLVAFMGCKGGTGASFIAANMAHILAHEFDKKCAFVDLDLQCGDASFYLGSGTNQHSLGDLTRQIDRLDEPLLASCLHAVTPRLNLLAAPHALENAIAISAQDIEKVLTLVRSLHEYTVVDLPRHMNALALKVLDMADTVFVVMQSQTQDVRDAQRLVKMLRALGLDETKLHLLVNRHKTGGWVSMDDLQKAVGMTVQFIIPNGVDWVDEALHTGQPLSAVNEHNAVIHALRDATASLLPSVPQKHRHWMQRWMGQIA
jgi:pilus assembly protein CpaE